LDIKGDDMDNIKLNNHDRLSLGGNILFLSEFTRPQSSGFCFKKVKLVVNEEEPDSFYLEYQLEIPGEADRISFITRQVHVLEDGREKWGGGSISSQIPLAQIFHNPKDSEGKKIYWDRHLFQTKGIFDRSPYQEAGAKPGQVVQGNKKGFDFGYLLIIVGIIAMGIFALLFFQMIAKAGP